MLIVHGGLITGEHGDEILWDGGVRVDGPTITDLGPSADLVSKYPQDEVLDARGMLIMPGLIDAHTHSTRIVARGMLGRIAVQDSAGMDMAMPLLDIPLDYETARYATLAYCIEALRKGITTFFSVQRVAQAIRYSLDAVAEPILQAGLRALLSYQVSDRSSAAQARDAVEENVRFARQVKEEDLLVSSMALDACTSLSNDSLRAAVGAAAVADIGFHIDVAGERTEIRDCLARYGMRPVERLRKFGALGPRSAAVNCLYISAEEMDLLRRANGWAVHTPRSNMHAGVGLAPVSDLLAHGVPVGLGSDGFPGSIWGEMEATYLLHRHGPGQPSALSAHSVVHMAVHTNAALASRIFRATLGKLAIGATADIVLLDYAYPTPLTGDNLAWHMLSGMGQARVDTVIVAGKLLMRCGELLTLDEAAILIRARQLAAATWMRD